jgi:aquaporin NIP
MKRYIAEAIGTFALVFCGTGAIVINEFTNGMVTHPGVAITFGLIVMGMIYAFGDISGAHINPAVTIAFAFAKKFRWREVPAYVVSQLLGAIAASELLLFLFPESEFLGATLPLLSPLKVFVLEVILSFFLMIVIINVSKGSKEVGIISGIAIGGIVLLEAMFAGPITGASMNPARSIAPALVSGHLQHLWIYITAPIIGCLLAVASCKLIKT